MGLLLGMYWMFYAVLKMAWDEDKDKTSRTVCIIFACIGFAPIVIILFWVFFFS